MFVCCELDSVQVVQNGRKVQVNIVKTEKKGWGKSSFSSSNSFSSKNAGVFSGEKMEAGTFLGIYSGELITEAIGESRRYVFPAYVLHRVLC